ncbi:DUF4886 domain-containing protein [Faecalibacter macacae]|uniref:DUF4886 domain-containing protein n=1 Tax=Faecalibacter macacae TaxID=1859289 RepID=A0A3L9MIS2_9FLAO|nr:DUF4886 domain-containing protein [Faecalibacter macacae]RLZ10539.1 DUF4886 domain-containing protein [Faecalibacter macacae]
MLKLNFIFILFYFLSCTSQNELYEDNYPIEIPAKPIDSIKILLIGNSFSEDAVEKYLHQITKSSNKYIYIGNLYISGGTLENHWNNLSTNRSIYRFFTSDFKGIKKVQFNYNLETAITEQHWDYISLQQVSYNSGIQSSFDPYLNLLIDEITLKTKLNQRFVLHQTWAYSNDSDHSGFQNYQNNQLLMYSSIVNTYNYWLNKNNKISFIIPAGTAIQNARNTVIGDNLTRDGYHLNDKGKLVVSYTWFQKLFKVSALESSFLSDDISSNENYILKKCANSAINNPDFVSVL